MADGISVTERCMGGEDYPEGEVISDTCSEGLFQAELFVQSRGTVCSRWLDEVELWGMR